jgi:hypothetical protein
VILLLSILLVSRKIKEKTEILEENWFRLALV